MHPLAFHNKRFHHANIAQGRRVLARYQLTPARFDLVYALYQHRQRAHRVRLHESLSQAQLCRLLGVTSRTVARMVASLIELEFLQRAPSPYDRRAKAISFTPEGLLRVRRAVHRVIHKSVFQRLFHGVFPLPEDERPLREKNRYRSSNYRLIDDLIGKLRLLRLTLGDFATLIFPAHRPHR